MRAFRISFVVVVLDQAAKYAVIHLMERGESIALIGDWLRLTFTENPGMAFGIEYAPPFVITTFSIIATGLIVIYMKRVGKVYTPYTTSLALVFGGAVGNIIDRVVNDKLYYEGSLFVGKVIDFIHVNVWRGYVPESIPFIGGKYVALFPIWNGADMAIVIGVVGILFFQKKFHENLAAAAGETIETTAAAGGTVSTIETDTSNLSSPDERTASE